VKIKLDSLEVERVRHRCRSHRRPGAGAGLERETQVPEPKWDRGAELSQCPDRRVGGDDRIRTGDPRLAKAVLYQLSYVPASPGDAGNVAEKSPRLQHPSDIESTERAIACGQTNGAVWEAARKDGGRHESRRGDRVRAP
jgi:hypothetical protein